MMHEMLLEKEKHSFHLPLQSHLDFGFGMALNSFQLLDSLPERTGQSAKICTVTSTQVCMLTGNSKTGNQSMTHNCF